MWERSMSGKKVCDVLRCVSENGGMRGDGGR